MNIGIIGHKGVIGEAAFYGFSKIGHKVSGYDIADKSTSLQDVLHTEVCFICVPTPTEKDGWKCDTSIVEKVIWELINGGYSGIIIIKSTIEPGTTEKLREKFEYSSICFVPEFLRERCAITDFLENHDVCIIGIPKDVSIERSNHMYDTIKKAHGNIPDKFVKIGTTEAELSKYFNNVHNAANIILANSFYEVCQKLGADYSEMKNAIVNRKHINDVYLDVNNSFRGYTGMCLPKDTKAMASLAADLKTKVGFFKALEEENEKYPKTAFPGMRKE